MHSFIYVLDFVRNRFHHIHMTLRVFLGSGKLGLSLVQARCLYALISDSDAPSRFHSEARKNVRLSKNQVLVDRSRRVVNDSEYL